MVAVSKVAHNLVPRVSHLPGGGKMRDPGNEVGLLRAAEKQTNKNIKAGRVIETTLV